jgi:Gluconate 2-dehydrogenase subunit 3
MTTEKERTAARREFLKTSAGVLGLGWLGAHWPAVAAAAEHAHAMTTAAVKRFQFLAEEEARDVEAVAAQIVPSGATPGATEAGVVHFIDHIHEGLFKSRAAEFRAGLEHFTRVFAESHPGGGRFADLGWDAQTAYLRSIETTPFFSAMRTYTVMGLLSSPVYGGNRDKLGWKLVGFDDRHVWEPPFGDYDRDYPGFAPYGGKRTG